VKQKLPFGRLERQFGRLMLAGVTGSAACLLTGLVLFLIGPAAPAGTTVVSLGLFALMATPALRVAVAIIEAVRLRDWLFVTATVAVILLLGLTLVLSLARL
jgi:uncharacterized membrane protein